MKRKHFNSILLSIFLAHGFSACAKEQDSTFLENKPTPSSASTIPKLSRFAEKTLSADIDGDGKQDSIYFVLKNEQLVSLIPDNVKTLRPFYEENKANIDFKSGSKHFLYFSLSSTENIIVHDGNAISVLDTEAASTLVTIGKSELNVVLSDNSIKAHGDGILLPTEAGIDVYLFWDGKSILLFEPLEMP